MPTRPAPPDPATPTRLALSIPEAAGTVGVSARTLWSEVRAGRLRSAKVGRRRLVRVQDLDAWLALMSEGE
ncbi:MAG: helix-turn-helix domain-containing protein [Phycisphaerae bacterium]|nr:helix-turn-helix domain-containing protein [Phycisphaerae bacterium]